MGHMGIAQPPCSSCTRRMSRQTAEHLAWDLQVTLGSDLVLAHSRKEATHGQGYCLNTWLLDCRSQWEENPNWGLVFSGDLGRLEEAQGWFHYYFEIRGRAIGISRRESMLRKLLPRGRPGRDRRGRGQWNNSRRAYLWANPYCTLKLWRKLINTVIFKPCSGPVIATLLYCGPLTPSKNDKIHFMYQFGIWNVWTTYSLWNILLICKSSLFHTSHIT